MKGGDDGKVIGCIVAIDGIGEGSEAGNAGGRRNEDIIDSAGGGDCIVEGIASTQKDDFKQITLTNIRDISLPKISQINTSILESLVTQILTQKQSDPTADTSALEAEIDVLVYRLYGLTYAEVLVVNPEFGLSEGEYESLVV